MKNKAEKIWLLGPPVDIQCVLYLLPRSMRGIWEASVVVTLDDVCYAYLWGTAVSPTNGKRGSEAEAPWVQGKLGRCAPYASMCKSFCLGEVRKVGHVRSFLSEYLWERFWSTHAETICLGSSVGPQTHCQITQHSAETVLQVL